MRLALTTRREARAFTLMEMMAVLALIAIMAAAILPEMHGTYEDARLRSSTRELIDAMNLAYSRAVTLNQQHRIRFDIGKGRYVIEKRARGEGGLSIFMPVKDLAGGEGKVDSHISLEIRNPMDTFTESAEKEPSAITPMAIAAPMQSDSSDDAPSGEREEAIIFYADGTADAREVVLKDQDGFRLALRVNPITARINIVELERQL